MTGDAYGSGIVAAGHDSPSRLEVVQRPKQVDPDVAFTPRQLARIDEALTMASRETGIYFTLYVGALSVPTRGHAASLHTQLGAVAARAVLLAVSPGQRVLEIVTGAESGIRLDDRACSVAALAMSSSFGSGDLTRGIVDGLRVLSDQAGRPG